MRKKKVARKPPLVVTAAYLEVCPFCQSHALIITALGKVTKDFGSKKSGREMIGYLLEFKLIAREEEIFLKSALNESPLMEEDGHEVCEFSQGDFMQEGPDITAESQHEEWIN